jgi:hypothetical protein
MTELDFVLSEFIKHLEAVKEEYGNVMVVVDTQEGTVAPKAVLDPDRLEKAMNEGDEE